MNLFGKAWNVIADWVVRPMGEPTFWTLDDRDQQRVHQYERISRAVRERGWRDTE